MIKLLMSWDIKSGLESIYFDFIVNEFAPGLLKLGVQPTEAWYTVYGSGPQILTGAVAKDLETMNSILDSDDWYDLQASLLAYVSNFEYKVVHDTGRFQL
ncbi:MAG: hypothetical protein H8E47_10370 [Anaerolineales bacterium]|nr:hypothetical protein [Anaerolineales bacterium]